jgi:hypothetical protein
MACGLALDHEIEHERDTNDAGEKEAGAAPRKVADHAVDHRASFIEQNLACAQSPYALAMATFLHGARP